ncbi:MAG: hypothetical protein HZA72_02690 [Candidatus Omnitrophica bacterium]|nr:hypothetical protein [Candidatus Omnitrophota bacterium]
MMLMRFILTLVALVSVTLGLGYYPVIAEEKAPQIKEETVSKSIAGTVAGVSANFIAVEYGADQPGPALEMAFNVGKDVKIENKKSIKEIGIGDTVEVAYSEITKIDQDGKKLGSRRVASKVRFIKAAPKTVETDALVSSAE